MPRWVPFALGLFCVVLTLVAIGQASRIGALKHDVEQLQAKVKGIERRQKTEPAPDLPTRSEVQALEKKIAMVEKNAEEGAEALLNPPPGAGLPTLIKEEDIQQIVDERLEEKLQQRGETGTADNSGSEDRKMALHDLAKELDLDPQVQAQVGKVADRAKKDIFELMRTPRADGGSLADDIIEAYTSGDGAKIQAAFTKIFTAQIPGTETSFLEGIGRIQDHARENLKGILGSSVYERYANMNLKPENIETGFDPWGEYFQQRNN